MLQLTGDGQYDSFMKAVKKIYKSPKKDLQNSSDYAMFSIPPARKTDAFVADSITCRIWKTYLKRSLIPIKTVAARWCATEKFALTSSKL